MAAAAQQQHGGRRRRRRHEVSPRRGGGLSSLGAAAWLFCLGGPTFIPSVVFTGARPVFARGVGGVHEEDAAAGAAAATVKKNKNLLVEGDRPRRRRRLEEVAACEPLLDSYYSCAGLADDDGDAYYYYSDDAGDTYCEAIARGDCSAVPDCQTEYATALDCYAGARCNASFACSADVDPPPEDDTVFFATLGLYHVDPARRGDALCFSYGLTTALGEQWSPVVTFGDVAYVDVALAPDAVPPSDDPDASVDVYFRVYAGCDVKEPSTRTPISAATSIVEVYATNSNLVRWGLRGAVSTVRRAGPEPAAYFLNQVSQSTTCEFAWIFAPGFFNTTESTLPTLAGQAVSSAEPLVVDLIGCAELESVAAVSVTCGDDSATAAFASVALDSTALCADTSLHFVAVALDDRADPEEVDVRLFQAVSTCDPSETCVVPPPGGDAKKKKKKSSASLAVGVIVAICLAVLVGLVGLWFLWCRRSKQGRRKQNLCDDTAAKEASPAESYEAKNTALQLEMRPAPAKQPHDNADQAGASTESEDATSLL